MKAPKTHSFFPRASRRPLNRKKGFALIVTLSLMILLTVIAVGLLTLSSISLRGSTQSEAMQVARANARLSLMLAINQLQTFTGPDQRITMNADQRPMATNGLETSAALGNRHWTGVYRSWPSNVVTRPEPEFLSWMVSGSPTAAEGVKLPETPPSDSVEIVGEGTLGKGSTGMVRVPTLNYQQSNKKNAKLAWWVGDQGMKAALATTVPSKETQPGVVRNHHQSAPRNAVELASTGTVKPFQDLNPEDGRIQQVTSWQQAEFLASSVSANQPLYHDITASTSGLLTNVTLGGFRKDLSLQLEKPAAQAPRDPLYSVGNEPGINLNELWVYYNSYNEVRRSGSFNFTTSGRLDNKTPYVLVDGSPTACSTDDEFFLKQPAIISYQMILSFQAFPEVVNGAAVSRIHVVADPVITLWNPLDVPVVIPQSSFITVKYWQLPYDIVVRVNGGPPLRAPLAASLSGSTTGNNADQNFMSIQMGTSQAEQIVMKPGEIVKFSQSGPVIRQTAGAGNKNSLIARKGFNYGGGFAMPLRDLAGKNIDVKAADQVTYEAFANNLTAGKTSSSGNSVTGAIAHTRHFSITHHEVYVGADRGQLPTSLGYGNMAIDWDFGNRRLPFSGLRAAGVAGTKPPTSRIYANSFPNVFRPVSGAVTRPLSGTQLASTKSPFLLLSFNAKTETGSETGTRSLLRFNPKAHHVDFYDLSQSERDILPYEFRAEPMTSWINRSLDLSPDGSGFFGGGMTAEFGTNMVATHAFPRQPLVSLAAFQHSFANGFEIQRPINGYAALNSREPMLPQIAHAIGNSIAPSLLDPDKTESAAAGNRPLADHSYLANRALWDQWFLSGVANQKADTFGALRDPKTVATDFFSGKKDLPVARYRADLDGESPTKLVNTFFSGSTSNTVGIENIASYLRVDGMFNINSTSVEAWKTLLGGLKGRVVVGRDATGKEVMEPIKTGVTPVTGVLNPQNLVAEGNGADNLPEPSQWVGRRELTETEIELLATAITREIRKRGPFLSLADFVNRRVGTDKSLARAGAIQSALDSDFTGINKRFISSSRAVGAAASRFTFKEAEEGAISQGIPGIVKQADILTPIAPILSARSDSFIIRGYGEAVDGSGKVTARAWCEAVVERDRNFVDPVGNRPTAATNTLTPTNAKFGRRYDMVSFRWLSATEV
jgi:Tfp pilus assembly protein PilX